MHTAEAEYLDFIFGSWTVPYHGIVGVYHHPALVPVTASGTVIATLSATDVDVAAGFAGPFT